jgi:hypothetical protein
VAGGGYNTADTNYSFCGGGYKNTARGVFSTVAGGRDDTAKGYYAGVCSGYSNLAGDEEDDTSAFVGGGYNNSATDNHATVCGGRENIASSYSATVNGGQSNIASGVRSTVAGGWANTATGVCSFSANMSSDAIHDYSSVFNGSITTATGQTRVGNLSKATGSFTIDHPLDPMNKILNHYFVESPEMINVYRGVAHLDSDGRAEVELPDYFDELNRNPMVQLTGVGTSDIYVLEDVYGNHFAIGGAPGTKVYWTVTGDRKDPSAEITRILMPVEQIKEAELAGRSLDDDFLAVTKVQLERMGQAGPFEFRTAAGREKYERSIRALESSE